MVVCMQKLFKFAFGELGTGLLGKLVYGTFSALPLALAPFVPEPTAALIIAGACYAFLRLCFLLTNIAIRTPPSRDDDDDIHPHFH
jgi:hypothetical protein